MNRQEVFDRVVGHLRKQGVKSKRGTECSYRGPGGLKCAIGCLIDDACYTIRMEGKIVLDRSVRASLKSSGVVANKSDMDLLHRLQMVHDHLCVVDWEEGLCDLANEFKLKYAPPVIA